MSSLHQPFLVEKKWLCNAKITTFEGDPTKRLLAKKGALAVLSVSGETLLNQAFSLPLCWNGPLQQRMCQDSLSGTFDVAVKYQSENDLMLRLGDPNSPVVERVHSCSLLA